MLSTLRKGSRSRWSAILIDIAEFLPIKLTPGFISVAFHLGCIGCNFCSVRYGNSRDRLFTAGIQRKYQTSPNDILDLLSKMPSFTRARVPIRIGNDTDLCFEIEEAIEFLNLLPNSYPTTLLTRFPIKASVARQIGRSNAIVKLTATPYSPNLDCPDNSHDVIASAAHFDSPVVVAIGPITADNFFGCLNLLPQIPTGKNVSVYLKPLNDEFHPSLKQIESITNTQYRELRSVLDVLGIRHLSQLMCPVNHNLRIHHKRVADVPLDEQGHCRLCASNSLCFSPESSVEAELASELRELGIILIGRPRRVGFKSWTVPVDVATAYGDEAYLSELFGLKIKLSGTAVGTGRSAFAASEEVLERWNRVRFFPYAELLEATKQQILEAFNAAEQRLQQTNRLE